MSTQNDGGLAFPYEEHNSDGTIYRDHYGVSARDYFAAKAPITVEDAMVACGVDANSIGVLSVSCRVVVLVALAAMRGEYADAMLAERAKGSAE